MVHYLTTIILLLLIMPTFTGTAITNVTPTQTSPGSSPTENTFHKELPLPITQKTFLNNGKTCFGYQVTPNPDLLVKFDTDTPETLTTVGTPITEDKIAGGTWVHGVWWCCEYSPLDNSKIWTINHLTGTMTLIGQSGEGLHSLAYDDPTGTMYACGTTHLFTIDMTTGLATVVGPYGITGSVMIGIACDGYGNMYAEDLHTDSLYTINPTSGTATLIGPLGLDLNYGQDMAIDKETGICYLAAYTVHTGNEGALYTCNLTTAIPTKIGIFGTEPTQITGFAIPYQLNHPPTAPTITGQIKGKTKKPYNYTITTTDSDNDTIELFVDWGDRTTTGWTGPYPSDEQINLEHTWNIKGTYIIKAKAKDPSGAESDWGTLTIRMPYSYIMLWNWLQQRFSLFYNLMI
jgi:hypothetical protein